jgi:hypothetical protein
MKSLYKKVERKKLKIKGRVKKNKSIMRKMSTSPQMINSAQ